MAALRLNPTSGTPLYVQLVERLKHSIATGTIKAGEQLPSVRAEPIVRSAVDRLEALDLTEDEIRRLLENELALRREARESRKRRA